MKIEDLDWTLRTYSILKRANINTIEEIDEMKDRLKYLKDMNTKSLEEINKILNELKNEKINDGKYVDRLTRNFSDACYDTWEICGLDNYCTRQCKGCIIYKQILRLSEIENILGNKYNLEELKQVWNNYKN